MKLQFHDGLAVHTEGIRVMDVKDDRLNFILGTDVIDTEGRLLRERSSVVHNGVKQVTLEVGEKGSGELFEVKINKGSGAKEVVHAVHVEPEGELFVAPAVEDRVPPEMRQYLVDMRQAPGVLNELHGEYLEWKPILEALKAALKLNRRLVTVQCSCTQKLLDSNADVRKCRECPICGAYNHTAYKATANPLAHLVPVLIDGKILFTALTPTFR